MARQRKNLPEINKEGKSRHSSSSNGSNSPNSKSPKRRNYFFFWKQLVLVTALGVAIIFGYMGYLETRVNTPFDVKKVITI